MTSMLFMLYVFQKHVTTFLMIRWTRIIRLQRCLAHLGLFTKTIGHRQVFLVSHLTYLVQLLYLGILLLQNCHDIILLTYYSTYGL